MKPEDVPDDLLDLFDKGSYERCRAYTGNSPTVSESEYFRGGIAAVYDQIETQVRAKVTEEIEAELARYQGPVPASAVARNSATKSALQRAAAIARGEGT